MKKVSNNLALAICAAMLVSSVFTACKKDDAPVITPPVLIGGYASSDSVASASLVAYFPFDGNANDTKGGKTATTSSRVTFNTGIRGQAYQGDSGAYATLTPSAAFSSLPSYSFSVWYKLAAQPKAGDPGGMFFLAGTTTLNEMIYEIESFNPKSGDSVKVHHGFTDLGSPGYKGFTMESFDTAAINKWVLLTTTYDGASSIYTIYQNGVAIGNNSAFGQNITPTPMWTDGTKTTPLGNLNFNSDPPAQIIIGTWPATLYGVSPALGVNGSFEGQMDELRIFNKALSSTEVVGLYLNGKAGR